MKRLLTVTIFLFVMINTASATEDKGILDDKSCRDVYNSAFLSLKQDVNDYNDGVIRKSSFSTRVIAKDTFVNSKRLLCLVAESPANKKCVELYKKRYKALRSKVKVSAVLLGNQDRVDVSILTRIRNEFGSVYKRLKCNTF